MDRRKFISVSGISLVGLNGIVSASTLFFQKEITVDISDFMQLIGAKLINNKLSDKQNEYICSECKSWYKLGYKNNDADLIWKAGSNTVIIPIQLHSDLSGILDQAVLIFNQLNDGDLRYSGSLSGFHFEIIEINKNLLLQLGDTDIIRSCVLPVEGKGYAADGGWAFKTEKGYFEMAIKIEKDKSLVSTALIADGKYVWQNSILSNHTLHSQSPSIV